MIEDSDNESTSSSIVICDRQESPVDSDNITPQRRYFVLPQYPESMVVDGDGDDNFADSDGDSGSDVTMDGEEAPFVEFLARRQAESGYQ